MATNATAPPAPATSSTRLAAASAPLVIFGNELARKMTKNAARTMSGQKQGPRPGPPISTK
eukprot:2958798-Pyramimonas_sp.AAC.1